MALSGTIYGSTSNERIKCRVDWSATQNIPENYSMVTATLFYWRTNNYTSYGKWSGSITINGERTNYTTPNDIYIKKDSNTVAMTATVKVPHYPDGTMACNISATGGFPTGSLSSTTLNEEITFDRINRYAKVTTFALTSKTETTATFEWHADVACDGAQISIDNGSWQDANGWPYFTVVGLSEGTYYNMRLRVLRRDSQLWGDASDTLTIRTYYYPYLLASGAPAFDIGREVEFGIYNPLGRTATVALIGDNGAEKVIGQTSTTSIVLPNTEEWKDWLYSTIPNSNSGTYTGKVTTSYGSKWVEGSNTYYEKVNEVLPEINSFTYKDANAQTALITQDDQRIIQNNSNLVFSFAPATAKRHSTITNYSITFNQSTKSLNTSGSLDFGKINLARNEPATLTVTDSRGNTVSKEITVIMDEWKLPTALIELNRRNNFYSDTFIKVDASYSSLNEKNTIEITVLSKKTTEEAFSSPVLLEDNKTATLDLDNTFKWDLKIKVKDRIGETIYYASIDRGIPIIFFDREKYSVGINCFPTRANSVEIEGTLVVNGRVIE